jgi:hypothetical protein
VTVSQDKQEPEPKGNGKRRAPIGVDGIPILRPVIHDTTDLHSAVNEAEWVLQHVPNLYQRDGQLVWIVRVSKDEATAKLLEGTPTIRLVPKAAVREMLCQYGTVVRVNSEGDQIPCKPCNDLVEALMARGQWRTVRPLTGIVEAPMMLRDGSIMQTPGYDRQTGFVYAPSIEFAPVPELPTAEQCKAASELLREIWAEFPWRGEADLAVVVALFMSILTRPAYGDVPAFALDATTPGSGKGLALDGASVLATGRRANKQTYAYDAVEQEKILGAMALRGASLIAFDDIKDPFGGSPLCKVLTCGGANSFRVLGKSEAPDLPWHAIITVTGNNIQLMGDIPRRVIMARLEPSVENPALLSGWRHHPLLEWCSEIRSQAVVAALTLARAWWLAGKPDGGCSTLGSFEAWAALVPPICVFAGFANPLECCPLVQNIEDPEVVALRCVLTRWHEVAGPNGDTIGHVTKRLWPHEYEHGEPAPMDGYDDLRAALATLGNPKREGAPPVSNKLGNAFDRFKGRICSGRKLEKKTGAGGIGVWRTLEVLVGKPKEQKTQQERNNSSISVQIVGPVEPSGTSVIPAMAVENSNVVGVSNVQLGPTGPTEVALEDSMAGYEDAFGNWHPAEESHAREVE